MKKVILALAVFAASLMGANAYEKRGLLQRSATEAEIKASLVMDQKWVPYPAYTDRNGWNNLLGDYRDNIIKTGEKCLDYKWEVVKASQYLEFEKSGSRDIMEKPNNRNSTAFGKLLMAELAEGKGRFLTDIMDACSTSASRPHGLNRHTSCASRSRDAQYPTIAPTCSN